MVSSTERTMFSMQGWRKQFVVVLIFHVILGKQLDEGGEGCDSGGCGVTTNISQEGSLNMIPYDVI